MKLSVTLVKLVNFLVSQIDNLIDVPGQEEPLGDKLWMLASGIRKKDSKVSVLLLSDSSESQISTVASIHINKNFLKITKLEHFRNLVVGAASNSIFFFQVNLSSSSIEIVSNVDLSICRGLEKGPGLLTDFCLSSEAIYFVANKESNHEDSKQYIYIKDFKDNLGYLDTPKNTLSRISNN